MHIHAQSPLSKFTATAVGTNTVNFSNTSSGSPNSVLWEFTGGSPSTSTDPNPSVSYLAAGIYTAKLTVSNASGNSVSTRTIKISAGNIIDLSSGKYDDGTIMADGIADPDWTYTHPSGTISTPVARYAATAAGWSSASTGGIAGVTSWITGNNVDSGYHLYDSKQFTIPENVADAVLNLRSLSFVRNWTYLEKLNADGSITETQVTATTFMSDGAKGWLNSRSPEVMNYALAPGKYFIRVKVYTNSTAQRQATDVNANISFGKAVTVSPILDFSASASTICNGSSVQLTTNPNPSGAISNNWKFDDGANVLTSNQNNPSVSFTNAGAHYAELTSDFGDYMLSSLKINNFIQSSATPSAPIASLSQSGCSTSSGSVVLSNLPAGSPYNISKNGTVILTDQTGTTQNISNLSPGTYTFTVTDVATGCVSLNSDSVTIAPAANPTLSIGSVVQPTCSNGGSITVNSLPITGWSLKAASTDYTYSASGTDSSYTFTGLQPGTYSVSVTTSGGCTATASPNVVLNTPVLPTFTSQVTQATCTTTGSITVTATPVTATTQYSFDNGQTYQTSNSKTGLLGGEYIVLVKDMANECTSLPKTVTIGSTLSIGSPSSTICKTANTVSTLQLSLSSTATGTWSVTTSPTTAGISISNAGLLTVAAATNLTAKVTATVKFTSATCGTITKDINIYPAYAATFSQLPATICYGAIPTINGTSTTILPNTVSVTVNGVTQSMTGTWYPASIDNKTTTIYTFTPSNNTFNNPCIGFNHTLTVTQNMSLIAGGLNAVVRTGAINEIARFNMPTSAVFSGTVTNSSGTVTNISSDANFYFGTISELVGYTRIIRTKATAVPGDYTIQFTCVQSGCTATETVKVKILASDQPIWAYAPNSYIFTGKDDSGAEADGIKIPVKKAFEMWKDNMDQTISFNNAIPSTAVLSAYVYWEDVSGLVKSAGDYKLEMEGTGDASKIKVLIDKSKGKGNALIALHAGANGNNTDPIYWSWHIWKTDNPMINGSTYRSNGSETRKNIAGGTEAIPVSDWKWMDRNLGATNAEFLGNDWNKSSGLMYQWGRKDPIPPLTYKDGTAYEVYGEVGRLIATNFQQNASPYGWVLRPNNNSTNHSEVVKNLKYATQNPAQLITYISRLNETWFSDQEYKSIGSNEATRVSWDLWADNRSGFFSNASSSVITYSTDGYSYELKSPFDPCPCGWRIPSHLGGAALNNNLNPFGRGGGGNDDIYNSWSSASQYASTNGFYLNQNINEGSPSLSIKLNTANPATPNIKLYPQIGFDFTKQTDRNMGLFPITGAFVFVGPNELSDYYHSTPMVNYVNWLSTGGAPTSTYSPWNGTRGFGLVSDYHTTPENAAYKISVNQTSPTKGAGTVRCMRDPYYNSTFAAVDFNAFKTDFIAATSVQYPVETVKAWTKEANSYIIKTTENSKTFNSRKAYAMHQVYTSANNDFPVGTPSLEVYWTTNPLLIESLNLSSGSTIENSLLTINRKPGEYGNAVVAMHVGETGTSSDPVIWSWHIWAPETDPSELPAYTTETPAPSSAGQVINPPYNLIAPQLKTIFMDRNLGALVAFPTVTDNVDDIIYKKSIGLHYQWGRKDPLPTFLDQDMIYKGSNTINSSQFLSSFISKYSQYSSLTGIGASDKRYIKTQKILGYSAANPLTFMYNDSSAATDWLTNDKGAANDRWGHASEKSPFDPCPDGWRIPDFSFNISSLQKGTSPWYLGDIADPLNPSKKGVLQIWDTNGSNPTIANAASNVYNGKLIKTSDNKWAGWIFNDATINYKIGNYPISGIRNLGGVSTSVNEMGVWAASSEAGIANAFSTRLQKMQTGQYYEIQLGMSCRCAKIQYDTTTGKEIGRYDPNAIPVTPNTGKQAVNTFAKKEIEQKVNSDKLVVYPNPVSTVLYINAKDTKDYYYQIYNMSGQLVKTGKFENKQTDVSSLISGAYLIRINDSEAMVKIIKK